MTQSQGEMREIYPEAGEVYRYRIEEREGHFTFDLEDEVLAGIEPATILSIESRETGEGLCRSESGRTHFFAWAWVGPELHLWLEGALHVFQRSETRRRGRGPAPEVSADVLAPMPGAVLEVLVSEGDRVEQHQTVVDNRVHENGAGDHGFPQWGSAAGGSTAGSAGGPGHAPFGAGARG